MHKRLVLCLVATGSVVTADTLLLRNGSSINGKFIGGNEHVLRFAVGSQVNTYDLADVDSLKMSPVPPAGDYSASSNPPPPPPGAPWPRSENSVPVSNQPQPTETYASPRNAPTGSGPMQMEIPAGTQIVVRLIDAADSERDRLGQTYRASVDQPVVLNGQTVIPRGADAVAVLNDEQQSGKIQGKTALTLALRSITVNGRSYDLASSSVSKASSSRGTKSGEVIGGTAALGAIIGAIAGGGKGAAIGGLSGAGVGTVAQVATSGQRVKVPSETVLTFTLQNPLSM